jgi:hypothetical protein
VAVPEEVLDVVHVPAGFDQVRGVGVSEGVDAAVLLDTGAPFRSGVDLLRDGHINRAGAGANGEEPPRRGHRAAVGAQLLQQSRRERDVAVLAALALLHAQSHAVGVEVGDFEGHHFAHAQPGRVGGGQEDVVQEAERVRRLGTRAPRAVALVEEHGEVGLDFVVGELVGRAVIVPRQSDDLLDVGLVGSG